MTGYESKRAAAQDKLDDDDDLTIAYQSGYYDGKKAAQPAQEPVACVGTNGELMWLNKPRVIYSKPIPLYTAPPQRPWVGLTDEEIALIDWESLVTKKDCVQAVEAKLKEKNT